MSSRLVRHNSGNEPFTSKGVPWVQLWSTNKPDRSSAVKLESKLKNLSRGRLLEFMVKYKEGIAMDNYQILKKLLKFEP